MPGGRFVTGRARRVAVEINRLLLRWKPVEERALGVSGELLDHVGYRVTVVQIALSASPPSIDGAGRLQENESYRRSGL